MTDITQPNTAIIYEGLEATRANRKYGMLLPLPGRCTTAGGLEPPPAQDFAHVRNMIMNPFMLCGVRPQGALPTPVSLLFTTAECYPLGHLSDCGHLAKLLMELNPA